MLGDLGCKTKVLLDEMLATTALDKARNACIMGLQYHGLPIASKVGRP